MSSSVGSAIRGFAWIVFADPDCTASMCGRSPFAPTAQPGHLWWIEGTEGGIGNPILGDTYLLVTETPELPWIEPGWSTEPAELDESFETEGGEIRLTRTMGVRRTRWGIVQECEFAAAGGGAEASFAESSNGSSHMETVGLPPSCSLTVRQGLN